MVYRTENNFLIIKSFSLSLSRLPSLSLSRLLVVGIDFREREIACLEAALGPLAYLAAALGSLAWLT